MLESPDSPFVEVQVPSSVLENLPVGLKRVYAPTISPRYPDTVSDLFLSAPAYAKTTCTIVRLASTMEAKLGRSLCVEEIYAELRDNYPEMFANLKDVADRILATKVAKPEEYRPPIDRVREVHSRVAYVFHTCAIPRIPHLLEKGDLHRLVKMERIRFLDLGGGIGKNTIRILKVMRENNRHLASYTLIDKDPSAILAFKTLDPMTPAKKILGDGGLFYQVAAQGAEFRPSQGDVSDVENLPVVDQFGEDFTHVHLHNVAHRLPPGYLTSLRKKYPNAIIYGTVPEHDKLISAGLAKLVGGDVHQESSSEFFVEPYRQGWQAIPGYVWFSGGALCASAFAETALCFVSYGKGLVYPKAFGHWSQGMHVKVIKDRSISRADRRAIPMAGCDRKFAWKADGSQMTLYTGEYGATLVNQRGDTWVASGQRLPRAIIDVEVFKATDAGTLLRGDVPSSYTGPLRFVNLGVRLFEHGSAAFVPILSLDYSLSLVSGCDFVARSYHETMLDLLSEPANFPSDGVVFFNPHLGTMTPSATGWSCFPNMQYVKCCPVIELNIGHIPIAFRHYTKVWVDEDTVRPGVPPMHFNPIWETCVGQNILVFVRRRCKYAANSSREMEGEFERPSILDLSLAQQLYTGFKGLRGQLQLMGFPVEDWSKLCPVLGDSKVQTFSIIGDVVDEQALEVFGLEIEGEFIFRRTSNSYSRHEVNKPHKDKNVPMTAEAKQYVGYVTDLKRLFRSGNGFRFPLLFVWENRHVWSKFAGDDDLSVKLFHAALHQVQAAGYVIREDFGTDTYLCAPESLNKKRMEQLGIAIAAGTSLKEVALNNNLSTNLVALVAELRKQDDLWASTVALRSE